VNALSAVPMSKFNSNKMLDMRDLKANGFTFGGTGLTTMCLYIAWWFSGDYPDFLRPFDIPIFLFWALVCAGTTANWEVMLQQNFQANERRRVKVPEKEMRQKAILYRLASWPNLTQLSFMYSIPFGGAASLGQGPVLRAFLSPPDVCFFLSRRRLAAAVQESADTETCACSSVLSCRLLSSCCTLASAQLASAKLQCTKL